MTSKRGSPLRMLLMLSAIDLLSSALTAGLVLFVILVGGNAGTTEASESDHGSALSVVTLVARSDRSEVFKQVEVRHETEAPNNLEREFFGPEAAILHRRRYFVPAGAKRLLIHSTERQFEILVQPASGDSFSIFVNCSLEGGRFELELTPLTLVACPVGDITRPMVSLPMGLSLLLPADTHLNDLPKPTPNVEGHSRYDLTSKTSVPATVTLWGVVHR